MAAAAARQRGCHHGTMTDLSPLEVWFVPGSQALYGPEPLAAVRRHAEEIARACSASPKIPVQVIPKPPMTSAGAIGKLCQEADAEDRCIGLALWMHTFSPARMWIAGLSRFRKPVVQLHTQYNRDLPWSTIDMDFMNLNQSAHAGREFGFVAARMNLRRKVIVGHWADDGFQAELGRWARAAAAWRDAQALRIARFGGTMRDVAVTQGDVVEAQIRLGYSVEDFGIGDLVSRVREPGERRVDALVAEYDDLYDVAEPCREGGAMRPAVREAARIELGLTAFLEAGGFGAFTDTFEDLHGLMQLPGVAVQRLMEKGYGFGAEGDWKTAGLVRAMKVMSTGWDGGTSFMEDYTYHFGSPAKVLGAHMLEVCPSLAGGRVALQVHPLAIGGKADPARLVFDARSGPAVNVCLVDLGNRFRMVVNDVQVVPPEAPLSALPMARAVWRPKPSLQTAAAAWIHAGGSHHTALSLALSGDDVNEFAGMADIECLRIDDSTRLGDFLNVIRWNEAWFSPRHG